MQHSMSKNQNFQWIDKCCNIMLRCMKIRAFLRAVEGNWTPGLKKPQNFFGEL